MSDVVFDHVSEVALDLFVQYDLYRSTSHGIN